MMRSRLAAGLDLVFCHRLLAALGCCLALFGISDRAAAQVGPEANQVILFDGPGYTGNARVVALDPQGTEIQHVATFAPAVTFRSILIGDEVAAYVYAYDPTDTRRENSNHRAPILQSSPSVTGVAAMVVVGPRYAIGPLNPDNPMRIEFEARFTITQASPPFLERMAFPIQYGSGTLCQDASSIADLEPHVLEVWTGNRPQSEVEIYLYPQPGCSGQGVHYVGRAGGIPMPPAGLSGPVRSFIIQYTGPLPYTRSTQGAPGQAVPSSPQAQMQTTPYEVAPPAASATPQPPSQVPDTQLAVFGDLSGRWQASTGEILDFTGPPDGPEWVATGPNYRVILLFLPSGRVRMDLVVDGQMASIEGDFYPNGPPAYQPNRNAVLVFEPLPASGNAITLPVTLARLQ